MNPLALAPKVSRKPASIGAMLMLAGGLMVYWALSQWKLFGLGNGEDVVRGVYNPPNEDGKNYETGKGQVQPIFKSGGGGSGSF
jgi:hypothetical protein